ncbi:S8 family peptidase [Enterococcus sp. RIT-PI-f]|uniref:S8 family peptidase n=1 Tax=Enterococcus sp. RIT-PI-f TaxID=1690244 RepID=UPI001364DAE0|nr:S8 family serine peptidase [Enterococcus sp. RIT-PI-f]
MKYTLFILIAGILFFPVRVNAQAYLDVLLEDMADLNVLKGDLEQAASDFSFLEIPEIGLIRISGNEEELEQFSDHELIEISGQLLPIYSEGTNILDFGLSSSQFILPDDMNSRSSHLDAFDLLEQLAWHKSLMTNEGESFAYSTGSGLRIALIDSGVDVHHPFLTSRIDLTHAKSFVPEEPFIQDLNSHGTGVAGVIAQVAPDATITPYKVLSSTSGDSFWALQAIVQAVKDEQHILNMSFGTYKVEGGSEDDLIIESFQRAVDYALAHSVLLVSSAGNNGSDLDVLTESEGIRHLPGSIPGVIAVSGMTSDYRLASYSNFGSNIHFTAPGGDMVLVDGFLDISEMIYGLYPTTMDNHLADLGVPQGYSFNIGTSLAAPAVTAILANYQAYHLENFGTLASIHQVKEETVSHALSLDGLIHSRLFGYGLPQITPTMQAIQAKIPPSAVFIDKVIEVNTTIEAIELLSDIWTNDGLEVLAKYEIAPDFSSLGKQQVEIVLADSKGNQTLISGLIVIQDTTPPTAKANYVQLKQFSSLDPNMFVADINDNHDPQLVTVTFDKEPSSEEVGSFEVFIRLTDYSGNAAIVTSNLTVIEAVTEEEAMKSVDEEKSLLVVEKPSNKKEKPVIAVQNTIKASDKSVRLPQMSDSMNQYYFAIGIGMVLYVLSHFVKKSRKKKYETK